AFVGIEALKAVERVLFAAMEAVQDTLLRGRPGGLRDVTRLRLQRQIESLENRAREYVISNHFDRILTENGARDMNATTGYEATTYYVRLPSNRAQLWFVLEADRMLNPVFREFYTERDVVAEERSTRIDANPGGRLMEAFYAEAYREHPYGTPVIGLSEDISTHTRAEVAEYHRRYYRPTNAVAVIVGDIDPDRILDWARSYFGPIPSGEEPPRVDAEEPPQTAPRRVEVPFDAEPELVVGWRVPSAYHEDAPALSVMTQLLAGGSTGRLHRRLVLGEGLATSVTASVGPGFRGPRLFTITAQPLAGTSTDELEAAIYDELDRLVREPPTPVELTRVRNGLEAGEIRRLADNLGLAFQLAESVIYHGDWRATFRATDRLTRVSADDVVRIAREYLVPENRTVAVLVPEGPNR
ncbi:MAG: M16 family metallopeptidase, partial [Gemmatimonadota bacterium]